MLWADLSNESHLGFELHGLALREVLGDTLDCLVCATSGLDCLTCVPYLALTVLYVPYQAVTVLPG